MKSGLPPWRFVAGEERYEHLAEFHVQELIHGIPRCNRPPRQSHWQDYTPGNSDGLSLSVSGAGGKSRHFHYSGAGMQKRMSFGTDPEVGLRQTRSLRD